MTRTIQVGVFLLLTALAVSLFGYQVDQREVGLKLRFGEIVEENIPPGLHFRIPFYNNILRFDSRILTLDAPPEQVLTSEKKFVLVDSFVKWKIDNAHKFFISTGGDQIVARSRMTQIMKDLLKAEFARKTLADVVALERLAIMENVREAANVVTENFGIKIVDVRVKRIELPDQVSNSIYKRMRTERKRVANELRAEGRATYERISATADKDVQILLANATRSSEILRGEGDSEAASIYASAYSKDAEFYRFYRSLKAYQKSFAKKSDLLILDPKNEFFDYFRDRKGKSK